MSQAALRERARAEAAARMAEVEAAAQRQVELEARQQVGGSDSWLVLFAVPISDHTFPSGSVTQETRVGVQQGRARPHAP